MSAWRSKALGAVCSLLFVGAGPPAAAATGAGQPYPRVIGQEHIGDRCTPETTAVAAGTIVGIAGQVVAGGGGTGVGCDTFYAYEIRTGDPQAGRPFVEPGLYLNPGESASVDKGR